MKGHFATLATLVAIACMPLGLIAARYVGFAGWLAVLVVWFASVAVAAALRANGRRVLSVQIARGREEWRASTARFRIASPVVAEPDADDIGLEEDLADRTGAAMTPRLLRARGATGAPAPAVPESSSRR